MTESTARVDTRLCRHLVNQLYVILRIVKIYQPNNASVANALEGFLNVLRSVAGTWENVTIEAMVGCLYVNGVRLKVDVAGYASHRYIVQEMEKFGLRNIIITDRLGIEELRTFAYAVTEIDGGRPGFEQLRSALDEKGISNISITKSTGADSQLDDKRAQGAEERAKKTYHNTIKIVKQIMHSASHFEAVKLRRAKRAVQSIVDSILHDESFLLSLATIKSHDEYTFNHCVNVCIYSVALGQRLGLSKSRLGQLGMAALFHDLGKVEIPWDILNKPEGLNREEWELVKAHTVHGTRLLAKLCRLDEQSLRAIVVAYEHHVNFDLTGYPAVRKDRTIDLFSKIVRITDAFDAMTTSRIYRMIPRNPHDSVLFLVREGGKSFDPHLVRVFVSMTGIYPVGTVLELDTGESAVVVKPSRDASDIARPSVSIIAGSEGVQCGGEILSLAETDGQGRYLRNVKRVLEADQFGLNVPELLVGPLGMDTAGVQ
ncbi:MAG: HD domain-containing protein [Candidatus Eiseniibacteriota bacterium]|nr:MAG: HD domain-containing protein [Candidatus Eisenbacteria bacterium]